MPYAQVMDLPENIIKVLPMEAMRIFMAAFNSAYEEENDDSAAMRAAWAAVRQAGFKKGPDGMWSKGLGPVGV